MFIVHYHKDTGQICAWGNGFSESSHADDHEVVGFIDEVEISPKTHRVDITTGELVVKTDAEMAIEASPRLIEVKSLVIFELNRTDSLMMPDRDVPDRDAWTAYRKALRDISKLPDVPAMIDGWPDRPDNQNVVADLKTRLAAARAAEGN